MYWYRTIEIFQLVHNAHNIWKLEYFFREQSIFNGHYFKVKTAQSIIRIFVLFFFSLDNNLRVKIKELTQNEI